jgi:hypothetical protein
MCSALTVDNLCAQHALIQRQRKHDENEANSNKKCTMKQGTWTLEDYCRCWCMHELEWFGYNELQLANVALIEIHEHHSGLDCKSQLYLNFNYRPGHTQQWKLQLTYKYLSRVSVWFSGMQIWGVPEWLWYTCIRCCFATNKRTYGSYSDRLTE